MRKASINVSCFCLLFIIKYLDYIGEGDENTIPEQEDQ
jgi:hypothetical protein